MKPLDPTTQMDEIGEYYAKQRAKIVRLQDEIKELMDEPNHCPNHLEQLKLDLERARNID